MFRLRPYYVLLVLGVLLGCEEDTFRVDPVVISEDVLFVSGEQVRLSGRLVATERQNVSDHGFIISADEGFSSPINISLGERSNPGLFIGQTTGLQNGQQYFWKPFSVIDGNQLEGATSTFTTLLPTINFISPQIAPAGLFMFINGTNFDESSRVFIGDSEAQVVGVEKESIIQIIVPPITTSQFVDVRVISQDFETVSPQQFEYVIGKWELVDNFITPERYSDNVSVMDGDTYYFGLGFEKNLSNPKLWSLDIPSFQWSEVDFDNGFVVGPFNGPDYFGGGKTRVVPRPAIVGTDIYRLESGEFVAQEELPFRLFNAATFKINGDTYVFGGFDQFENQNIDVWRYRANENTWEVHSRFPFTLSADYPTWTFDGFGFFITPDGSVYIYEPEINQYARINFFPSNSIEDGNGMVEVIGDKVYLGLFGQSRTVWEYSILTNSWKQKTGLSGSLFTATVASFNYDGNVYVLKNPDGPDGAGMSIFKFSPNEF